MKKLLTMALVATLTFTTVSCSSSEPEVTETPVEEPAEEVAEEVTEEPAEEVTEEATEGLVDGTYKAEQPEFVDEYKDFVEITVEGGVVTNIDYDSAKEDGTLKSELSESGEYGMVAYGNASSEWHEQVALLEEAALASQAPVDTVSGVTIDFSGFNELYADAIAQASN
ncbi:MAG: hypothetical protein ACK5LV_10500 [Lachnospirales bacterium]